MRRPDGNVILAGSDLANGWAGFIDGRSSPACMRPPGRRRSTSPVLLTAVGSLKQPGRIELRCVGEEIPAFGTNLNLMEKVRITAVKLAKFTSKPTSGGP
jgi:hypothetical protein